MIDFRYFKYKSDYDLNNSHKSDDICFIEENGSIYTHEKVFSKTNYIECTYAKLKSLREHNALIPGAQYRITDYVATTTQDGSRSTNHPFDIIVTALTNNTLSEEAKAALHSGDTYFAPCKIGAWKIWYCLDNASNRFTWADTEHGKGVIYRMIDEYGNDVPYDFKGIQFKRYKITSVTNSSMSSLVGLYIGHPQGSGYSIDTTEYKWYYTFSKMGTTWDEDVTDAGSFNSYTTDIVFDTLNMTDSNNNLPGLLDNVFAYGPVVHEFLCNEEGVTPSYHPLTYFVRCRFEGTDSRYNTIVGWAGLVTTRDTFRRNTIVGSFRHLEIGTNCQSNILFNYNDFSFCHLNEAFSNNSIYSKITSDTNFGSYFRDNTISADCIYHSSFPNYVGRNTFNDIYFGSVRINGQLLDCTFSGKFMACNFSAICGYCDFKGGTNGNSVVNLDVVGGIRGTAQARVNVENTEDFIYPDALGTKRRICLEGDTNGNMVISWYSNGKFVKKTKGASGSVWTILPEEINNVTVSVDNTSGTPSATGTINNGTLELNFSGIKGQDGQQGPQGNPGSSVDYPFELVNNLTTDDATKALSAAQGVVLDGKISQLGQEVNIINDVVTTGKGYPIDFFLVEGYRITSGKWTPGEGNSVYIIPCKGGDIVTATRLFQYAWLASYSTPTDYADVPFVPGTTNNVPAGAVNVTAPEGTQYICVLNTYEQGGVITDAYHENVAINGTVFDAPVELAESPNTGNNLNILSDIFNSYLGSATSEGYKGYIYQTVWAGLDIATHRLIKVRGGDVVTITAGENGSRYAFLKDYITPVFMESPIFATGSSNTVVSANQTATATAPEDAKYLYLMHLYNGNDFLPSSLTINGKEVLFLTKSVEEALNGLPSIIIERRSATTFNVRVYSDKKRKYINHQFFHFYYEKDIPYGDNQTAHLVTADCWFPSEIYDEGEQIVQGNVNFINMVAASEGEFANENSYVGEGHGCAVAVFTKFILDGKEIDPLSLTAPVSGEVFRFVEKVNYYAADHTLQEEGVTYPKVDANGEMILANIHFAEATYRRNNVIDWHNKLTVKRDHTIFEELFAGMVRVYLPSFDNVILGDAEDTANSFSHDGTNWSFVDTGGSGILLGNTTFLKGDNLIFFGDEHYITQTIQQVNRSWDKLYYRITKYNDSIKSLKIYQYPAICTSLATALGLQPDEFMEGDVIECYLTRQIDCDIPE